MLEPARITTTLDSTPIDNERYLTASGKLPIDDIDWAAARTVGLTEKEVFLLTYFSDIEAQTVIYMRDLLSTKAAEEQHVLEFLTIWNYEEFFHGEALYRLLTECGHGLGNARVTKVRQDAKVSEALESMGAAVLSRIFANEFPAVHASWGAMQEATTLRGYEELGKTTQNPVLKILCDRIAKQERRHFAWYFNNAKERLSKSRRAQWLTRKLMTRFWSPVGAGVKSKDEVKRLITTLFSESSAQRMAEEVDTKIGSLPGLTGIALMRPFVSRCSFSSPPIALASAA